jgi:hypothetical protein
VEAEVDGQKDFDVMGTGTATDGFMRSHDNVRVERTFYDLDDIQGTLETSMAVNPSFSGWAEATVTEDVCQHWERAIRSTMDIKTQFSATAAGQDWASLSTDDMGTFYSQLTGIEETFSLNEFLRSNSFVSDDSAKHDLTIAEATYVWQVKGMERVGGRDLASLHVNITMDEDTLDANNLNSFFIDVWMEPGLSQPSKYHVYVGGREEGNTFRVDLTEVLTMADEGDSEAYGLPCGADHSYTVKAEYPDDFSQLDRVPEQGGTAGGFQFNPEDAYQEALTEADFAAYISSHPNAFFHLGNYTENGDTGTWEMTFGQDGSSEHYWVKARGQSDDAIRIVDDDGMVDDSLPLSSRDDVGEVVTLSRGLRLLRAEPEIGQLCFDGQDVDWSGYTFNITEGVSTLSLDPASVLVGARETGYVYMLVGRSGPVIHQAALDATNGQVLFSWTHSQTWTTFEGFV